MTRRSSLLAGIDLGSTAVRLVAGQVSSDGIQIVGAAESPSEGISRGTVTSLEDAVTSLSLCLEKLERMTGVPLESGLAAVSGPSLTLEDSRGVIAVARADGEIRQEDVARVLEAAEAVATPPNAEILHVLPKTYSVDGQGGIRDPIGMSGVRLEVQASVIEAASAHVKNITKCLDRVHIELDGLVASGLACAEAVTSRRQRELGVAVVNLGGATTTLAAFEEGDMLTLKVWPVGGRHVTSDLAIGLRTSIDTAEEIKLTYGACLPEHIERREEFDLSEVSRSESGRVPRREVVEIIQARLEEILNLVQDELERVGRAGKLPAGVILCGGGGHLTDLVALTKKILRLPVALGTVQRVSSSIDHVLDPAFVQATGLLLYAGQKRSPVAGPHLALWGAQPLGFARRLLSHFLP